MLIKIFIKCIISCKWIVPVMFVFTRVRALFPSSLFTCSVARWHFSLCRQRLTTPLLSPKQSFHLLFVKVAHHSDRCWCFVFLQLPTSKSLVSSGERRRWYRLIYFHIGLLWFCVVTCFPSGNDAVDLEAVTATWRDLKSHADITRTLLSSHIRKESVKRSLTFPGSYHRERHRCTFTRGGISGLYRCSLLVRSPRSGA